MPVQTLIRRLPEVGRIRMGAKGANGAPRRLEHFRLTSQDKALLEHAAEKYGGTVKKWEAAWELFTTRSELPILLIPQMPPDQYYELWSAGGCQRRCDGITELLKDEPCHCDSEQRECKLVTRVPVMLPELPGLGVWRFDTGGFYAGTELPGMIDMLLSKARMKQYPSAALAIEVRTVKRNGTTKKFPVATIRIRETLGALIASEEYRAVDPAPLAQIEAARVPDAEEQRQASDMRCPLCGAHDLNCDCDPEEVNAALAKAEFERMEAAGQQPLM